MATNDQAIILDGSPEYIASITDPDRELNKHLCTKCQLIFHGLHKSRKFETNESTDFSISHHGDINTLEQSARTGCPLCDLFFREFELDEVKRLREFEDEYESAVYFHTVNERWWFNITIEFYRGEVRLGLASVRFQPSRHETKSGQEASYWSLPEQTDSIESWGQIRRWIDICKKEHESCRMNRDFNYMPTRLIEVGLDDTAIRLRLSATIPSTAEYLTLSHCWGTLDVEKLTSANLDLMLDRIPAEALTKTFRDAIITTRRLGHRYLWIDALCIIQDSSEDWQQESAKMMKVYACSALNIAALDSPDGNTGCLFTGRAQVCTAAAFFDRHNSQVHEGICTTGLYHYDRVMSTSPLMKRAWVFQELFLSPRCVLFGKSEIMWSCRCLQASEMFPEWVHKLRDSLPETYKRIYLSKKVEDEPEGHVDAWRRILDTFSAKSLTFDTDKLVALSGVAEMFSKEFQVTYVAGLWKEELRYQLIWCVFYEPHHRPTDYRAPSWSWASVNGNACYFLDHLSAQYYITIEEVSVELSTANPFGQVSSGDLLLKAHISPIKIEVKDLRLMLETPSNWHVEVCPDTKSDECRGVMYLLLMCGKRTSNSDDFYSVLLSPLEGHGFRRVGLVIIWIPNEEQGSDSERPLLIPPIFESSYSEEGTRIVIR